MLFLFADNDHLYMALLEGFSKTSLVAPGLHQKETGISNTAMRCASAYLRWPCA